MMGILLEAKQDSTSVDSMLTSGAPKEWGGWAAASFFHENSFRFFNPYSFNTPKKEEAEV